MIERVMVFTPYGPRLEPETVQAVLSLRWRGPIRRVFQADNPHGSGRENILHQYQRCDYDADGLRRAGSSAGRRVLGESAGARAYQLKLLCGAA